jgi:hypothetical protein
MLSAPERTGADLGQKSPTSRLPAPAYGPVALAPPANAQAATAGGRMGGGMY